MKSKSALLWGLLLSAVFSLSACSKEEQVIMKPQKEEQTAAELSTVNDDNEKVVLRMSYWNSRQSVESLLEYLKEAVPEVEIEFQYINNDNYNTVIDTQLSTKEGPDIICESPASAVKHARLGYLKEVNALGELYSYTGVSAYTYKADTYAIPGISWFEGIFYNKEIFREQNIPIPQTFDEFLAVCKKLQEADIKPMAAGLMSWEPLLKSSLGFVTAEYFSTDEGQYFNEGYREGRTQMRGTLEPYIEKWAELLEEGVYTKGMLSVSHEEALKEFAMGKAAMFCSGPWDYDAIISLNKELEIDMMPFLGTREELGWLIGGPGCGFAINNDSKHIDLCVKVLEAISTVEGQMALWDNNSGGSSYLIGAAFALPEAYESVAEVIAKGNIYCPWNEWGEAAAAHEQYGIQMQAFLQGQSLDFALHNVDAKVAALLK